MREIVLVRPKIGFGLGGAETHAANIALKLLERGFKVCLLAQEIKFPLEIQKELKVLLVPKGGRGSLGKYLYFLKQARNALASLGKDYLIFSPFRFPSADILILCDPLVKFWIKKRPIPQPFKFLSNFGLRVRLLLYFEKKSLFSAKRIIATSSLTLNLIRQLYPQVLGKTVLCYRGIDLSRFNLKLKGKKDELRRRFNLPEDDFLILFVGREPRRKGLPLLLKIGPSLPANCKVLIAGISGKSTPKVIYLGKVDKMEELYACADLVVLPTLYDPSSLTTLEALASGTPIITSIYDGAKDFITEGKNGWLTTLTEEDLLEKIKLAIKNKISPEVCAETVKNLTWDNYVDCLISQLEEL